MVTLKKRFKNIVVMFMPIIIIGAAFFLGGTALGRFRTTALVLAGAQMPAQSVGIIFDELEGSSEEEIQKEIDALEIPDVAKKKSAETPTDIQTLIEQAEVEQADAEKSGDIREVMYEKNGATDIFENIYVKNVTNSHSIDIKKCLESKALLDTSDKSQPLVLIYHTHTTEAYEMLDRGWYSDSFPTRSSDSATNMVRVGDALCESLEKAGYTVIHDREIHDTSYTGSYARSREAIESYKKQYPSLQVIIDVHRDGMKSSDGTKIKPVATINGKKSAQIMIIAGCQDGKVTEFKGWKDNLNFAVQLQKHAEDLYPGLMRPIYFSPRKYNMDTSPCGVLLEMGSDANTLSEAVYAGSLIGDALADLMNSYR